MHRPAKLGSEPSARGKVGVNQSLGQAREGDRTGDRLEMSERAVFYIYKSRPSIPNARIK